MTCLYCPGSFTSRLGRKHRAAITASGCWQHIEVLSGDIRFRLHILSQSAILSE